MTIHRGAVLDQRAINTSAIILYQRTNCSDEAEAGPAEIFAEVTGLFDLSTHCLAMLGNLLSVAILCRQRIGGEKMNQLLLLLTSTEVLYTGFSAISELLEIGLEVRPLWMSYLEIFCRLCAHTFLCQRNWWVLSIAAVRYLVISRPLRMKKSVCYTATGLRVLYSLLLLPWIIEGLLLTSVFRVVILTCADTGRMATLVWALHRVNPVYKLVEALIVIIRTILPALLISLFSSLTLAKLCLGSSVRRTRLSAATRTILLLTLLFVLLELPYGLTCIFCFLDATREPLAATVYLYYSGVSNVLVALDSLSNTIIYCVACPAYRHALVDLVHCRRQQSRLHRQLNIMSRARIIKQVQHLCPGAPIAGEAIEFVRTDRLIDDNVEDTLKESETL